MDAFRERNASFFVFGFGVCSNRGFSLAKSFLSYAFDLCELLVCLSYFIYPCSKNYIRVQKIISTLNKLYRRSGDYISVQPFSAFTFANVYNSNTSCLVNPDEIDSSLSR